MRIETCGKNNYIIFINSNYVKADIFLIKEELIKFIKEFMFKIKNRLNLRGFYKLKVYLNSKIGIFLDVNKLDDIDLTNNLDLRILVLDDVDFYFETDDYEVIKNCNDKRYKDGHFYCIVDDSFDELLEKVEFGRFIYGKEVINLLNNSLIL